MAVRHQQSSPWVSGAAKKQELGAAHVRKLAKKHQSQRCSKERESSCQSREGPAPQRAAEH